MKRPHWYGEKWWHEDRYRSELRDNPPLDEIDQAIERVAKLFDEKWVASCDGGAVEKWLNVELPKAQNPGADLLGETADGRLVHMELQRGNDANR